MDFDNKVAEGINHLDVSPNPFHKIDFSSLARCCRNWLPVLVTITSEGADNGGDKDLGISDDWIADNVAIQTRSSHGVRQPSFSIYFEKSASLSKPKTWSAPINTSIKFWLTKYCELTRLCSLSNVSRFAPNFWWQLVGCRVLRYCSISVQSRALLPATCTTWFLSTNVDILEPNSCFGYRCCSLCSSFLLFCLCCTFSMLSWYWDHADSSAVFSSFHGIVWKLHKL